MKLEEYTADAICRAMELPAFIEEPWTSADNSVLRLVLKPSFHPEVCVTMLRSTDETQVVLIALRQNLWYAGSWRILPSDRAQFSLPAAVFDEVVSLFEAMRAAFDPNHRIVFCDGMGFESCLVSGRNVEKLRAQVINQFGITTFVGRVLQVAWQGCGEPRVANAFAQAAHYVGLEYPLKKLPAEPESTRLMVLGAEQERHDYLEALKKRKEALKQSSEQAKPRLP